MLPVSPKGLVLVRHMRPVWHETQPHHTKDPPPCSTVHVCTSNKREIAGGRGWDHTRGECKRGIAALETGLSPPAIGVSELHSPLFANFKTFHSPSIEEKQLGRPSERPTSIVQVHMFTPGPACGCHDPVVQAAKEVQLSRPRKQGQ